ncbi:AMP-binding protein [Herminiimonas sp. KBW02]|uniref:AMP-binding protein n=1 Tax=Herminiimonas sp. KBW02 TaxID=2153363 RepID=UPI000F5A287D|nr:AMP-binding protein [Herminiimonas sp. KBW02]RQO37122.1 AMP-binding protein [Herminiimonas sp. KBW02]
MSDSLFNLQQLLAQRPAQTIMGWRDGAPVCYEVFLRRVSAWYALLDRTDGKNFALYLDDSIEFAAALLAAWHAEKTIWLTADTMAASCTALEHAVDGFLGEFPAQWSPLQPAAEDAACKLPVAVLNSDLPALVVHTSGTTGAAQAIPKNLGQLSSEVMTLEATFGSMLGDASIVATVSHQHIYGLLFKVLWPLWAGRAIHARSQNFPEQLAQLLSQGSCALIASPAHLKRLPDHLAWSNVTALRAIFSSGGPLSLEGAQTTAQLLGQVPIEVYGSSETGGIAWRQRSAGASESWLPMRDVEWRVTPDEGLLQVRSPHLPNADWFALADRAQAEGSARFILNGRSDRIAKIEEKRISLNAIEALLVASPCVSEVNVVVCDEVSGQRQRLAAFIVLSEHGLSVLADQGKLALNHHLRDLLVGNIEPVAIPRRWRYLEQMPVNAQGKTTRALLLSMLDTRPRVPQLRLLAQEEKRIELEVTVPSDLFYFDGHFPEAPILPGVVQLDWAISYGRQYFELPLHFQGVNALKFQHVIQADQPVTLELLHDAQKNSLNFRYYSPQGQHASGRILFAADAQASAAMSHSHS